MKYHSRSQAQNRFQIDFRNQVRFFFFQHERYRSFEYRRFQSEHESRSKKRQRITKYVDLDSKYSNDLEDEPQSESLRFLAAAQIYRKNSISLATHVTPLMRKLSKRREPLIELEIRLLQNLRSAYTE